MKLSRREFTSIGGALFVSFSLPGCSENSEQAAANNTAKTNVIDGQLELSNWIKIQADGVVQLALGKVELGQGIGTALAQIAADELGVDLSRISLLPVDTNHSPNESYTFSSISIQQSGPKIRQAAITARHYLLKQAVELLDTQTENLKVSDGNISLENSNETLTYWQLLDGQNQTISGDEFKELDSLAPTISVGTSAPRIDIPAKVFGGQAYLQDLRIADMLHARVVHPPAPRASLTDFNADAINGMPGVVDVIRDGSFVAVVAEREEQARKAAASLKDSLQWSLTNDLPGSENQYTWLKNAPSRTEDVAVKPGNPDQAENLKRVAATYQRPFQSHASISPSAAIAQYADEMLTVWSHAQGMYPLRSAIAHTLGLEEQKVRCLFHEASGCYGHNGADDAACEAAALATRMPGKAIRLQWERDDEFLWEPYGSAMQIEVNADIDAAGSIKNWNYDLWSCSHSGRPTGPTTAGNLLYAQHKQDPLELPPARSIPQPNGGSDRNAVPLYAFDAMRVNKHLVTDRPLRGSSLRGLGAYANVFAIESFMDELALNSKQDPLSYRLQHLDDPRAKAVLEQLAIKSDWKNRPAAGTGVGWGVGFAQFKNLSSYLGVVVQLEVAAATGKVTLANVIGVCDAGLIINPDGVKAQIEGGIIQSASWTLKEQLSFSDSEIHTRDWASYPILRFDEIPNIDITLMPDNGNKSLGVGETAQGPAAAAIANAIQHASGQRLRQLPLVPGGFSATA